MRTLAAVVFTDLGSGSNNVDLVVRLCHEFDGQVVTTSSSGTAMLFRSAVHAAGYSLDLQQRLGTGVRAGLHLGDIDFSSTEKIEAEVATAQQLSHSVAFGRIGMSRSFHQVVKHRLSSDGVRTRNLKWRDDSVVVINAPASHSIRLQPRTAPRLQWGNTALVGASLALLGVGAAELYSAGQRSEKPASMVAEKDPLLPRPSSVIFLTSDELHKLGIKPGAHFIIHRQSTPLS